MMKFKLDQMRKEISDEIDFDENELHNIPPCLNSFKNPTSFIDNNLIYKSCKSISIRLEDSENSYIKSESSSPNKCLTQQQNYESSSLCTFNTELLKLKTAKIPLIPNPHFETSDQLSAQYQNNNKSQINKSISKITELRIEALKYQSVNSSQKTQKINNLQYQLEEESKHKEKYDDSFVNHEDIMIRDISHHFYPFPRLEEQNEEIKSESEGEPENIVNNEFNVEEHQDIVPSRKHSWMWKIIDYMK